MAQNQNSRFFYQVRKKQVQADTSRNQPLQMARPAFIGDANGVITNYQGTVLNNGYIIVRDYDGNLSIAFNQRVPNIAGTPIFVGYDPLDPNLYQVLATRGYYSSQLVVTVPSHAWTHQWNNYDAVFVQHQQILPGLVIGAGGMLVAVYPFPLTMLDGTTRYILPQSADLTSHVPTAGSRWVIVAFSQTTGLIGLQDGPILGISLSDLLATNIPAPSAGTVPLAAVACYAGQTAIIQTLQQDVIVDMRGWARNSTVSPLLQYSTSVPQPLASVGWAGDEGFPAQGNHVHPLPPPITDLLARFALAGKFGFALTADQDDWNPNNLDRTAVLQITLNANHYIGGIQGGYDGRVLLIINADPTYSLTIKDNAGTSSSANRFSMNGHDLVLAKDGVALAIYDITTSLWRVVSGGGGGGTGDMLKAVYDITNSGRVDWSHHTEALSTNGTIDPTLTPITGHGLAWDGTKYVDTAGAVPISEDLTGLPDGVATHFLLPSANVFIAGSLQVIDNGITQNKSVDVTEDVGHNGFTLSYAPAAGHSLFVTYITQSGTLAQVIQRNVQSDMFMWAVLTGNL